MSHSTKPSVRHAIIATTALPALFLAGCNPQSTAELSQSERQLILEEIGLDSTLVGYPTQQLPTLGPSLIAGDWLAIQCAQASGYLNWTPQHPLSPTDQDPSIFAPVYASFLTSDFE